MNSKGLLHFLILSFVIGHGSFAQKPPLAGKLLFTDTVYDDAGLETCSEAVDFNFKVIACL